MQNKFCNLGLSVNEIGVNFCLKKKSFRKQNEFHMETIKNVRFTKF